VLSKPPGYWSSNPVLTVIARGEGRTTEFKSSVLWDLKQDKHNLVMRDEVLKEICAFLNAEGGTILCGVDDAGRVLGLRKDLKHAGSRDKLGLQITNPWGDLLRPSPVELVRLDWCQVDGETVLQIDVMGDPGHRYESKYEGKMKTFVRIEGSAKVLEGEDLINWWDRRRGIHAPGG
jgi:predicted HTH transcriptional regulator